jgi:hypothetical protein
MASHASKGAEQPANAHGKAGPPELADLVRELGDETSPVVKMYIEELQTLADAGVDLKNPDAVEAELRRREYERVLREFKPVSPLYEIRVVGGPPVKKPRPGAQPSPKTPDPEKKRGSYQNDPRYREFYDRLRRNQEQKPSYDDPPEAVTLSDLDRQGWDGTPLPWKPSPTSAGPTPNGVAKTPPQDPTADLIPGTIMSFDDGSIAIYRDAVSGKDYALFYFLEPDGGFAARGIFLEQYERLRIGALPPDAFDAMIRSGRWDRDALVYHLDRFEYASYLRGLVSAPPAPAGNAPRVRPGPLAATAPPSPPVAQPQKEPQVPAEPPRPAPQERPITPPPPRDPLERGRNLRINVGGRIWEAVYWTKDEIGPIVAHNTHREWSLMHLDLSRFKDAMEFGDLLEPGQLSEIEASLARQGR